VNFVCEKIFSKGWEGKKGMEPKNMIGEGLRVLTTVGGGTGRGGSNMEYK